MLFSKIRSIEIHRHSIIFAILNSYSGVQNGRLFIVGNRWYSYNIKNKKLFNIPTM